MSSKTGDLKEFYVCFLNLVILNNGKMSIVPTLDAFLKIYIIF